MEPIGTITQYFPFLDDETRRIMQSIMEKADNYHDFVSKLKNTVLHEDPTELLAYFALHHSGLLLDIETVQQIADKFGKLQLIRPSLFYASVLQGNSDHVQKAHEAVDAVLETNPPDWLALEMRCLKFEVDLLHYPKRLYDSKNVDEMESLIQSNPQLDFFNNILYDYYSERAQRDGDFDELVRCNELSIEYAEKSNDIVRLAYHLRSKAEYLHRTDLIEARSVLLRAKDIMTTLGIEVGIASILFNLSRLDAIRGEYNFAIERNLEVIRIRENLGLSLGIYALMLSTVYNAIGEPESGLEWAKLAEQDFEAHPGLKPRSILNQAWSYCLMNRSNEAAILLDSVREMVLKSGMEGILAWFYFVTGVKDMIDGNLDAGKKNIEDAMDLYEGKPFYENSLIFMHYLAQLDAITVLTSASPVNDVALNWLRHLEEKARADDLPGILGQCLVLKALVTRFQNDIESFNETLYEISAISTEPGSSFLSGPLNRLTSEG
ncbi:MAG: hypothetical protein ACFFDQ_10500 [Candidatus Thorarchaeota archaeon]